MIDREKVLKGLECCCSMTGNACRQCPYDEECAKMIGSGSAHLCANALELLKQQPEIVRCKDCTHWDDDDCEIGNNPQMFADDWYCPCGEVRQE